MEEKKCNACGEIIENCKCEEKCGAECNCEDDNCNCEEDSCECNFTAEDLLCHTDDKIEALINLLIKKGVITEEEYDKAYTDLINELENEQN